MPLNDTADRTRPFRPAPPGSKVQVSDCRECGIWRSLVQTGMPALSVQAICKRMWLNVARRGQVLYLEGNLAQHLYVVRRGTVKLVKTDASGREHVTAILDRGSLFGFESAFDRAYATGAEAHTDCELCLLSAEELKDLMQSVPGFSVDFARYVHDRLTDAHQRLAFLGNSGAKARLAGYLLWRLPANRDEGSTVPHELTLRELGGILGLSPETVCRMLGAFQAEGIIELRSKQIVIRDGAALDHLAAQ